MPTAKPSDMIEQFRDPVISMFQSAAAATDARSRLGAGLEALLGHPPVDHASAMMQATTRAAQTLSKDPGASVAAGAGGTTDVCAHAYLALALAKARGDAAAIAAAQDALPKFGTCDAGWAETIQEFLLHYTVVKHGNVPYVRWKTQTDFVFGDTGSPPVLPDQCKVLIIGDWGTGTPRAQALLEAAATQNPDVVIHLGDIYYSCDAREADAFFNNITKVFPAGKARVFTLCGNHDMYGGGVPYYSLLDRLGQPASFFCLRNEHWQLLAMDTGYNDFDPLTVSTSVTWVQDGTGDDGRKSADTYSELAWHMDKLQHAAGRKTVLLSHHPLFSLNAAIDTNRSVNGRLLEQIRDQLPNIDLWLWGHEHNQLVYQPFEGLKRGRCVGASAIPVLSTTDLYNIDPNIERGSLVPDLIADNSPDTNGRLRVDKDTGLWDLGYAMLTLAGNTGSVDYYTFNQTTGPKSVYTESL